VAVRNLNIAIQQAREFGLLGENILGTGFSSTWKSARAPARLCAAKKPP
jgi:NADH:ubiquinone oxidoreductase subunit F (NADH-binding)